MLIIRYATLSDTNAIHEIHRSDIHEWKASTIDDEGVRYKRPATWEECSLLDRWEHGGAWMSPELCAIHLNRILQQGHIPLVAEMDGKVVGEMELYLEEDGEYGFHANLSVFYLHADYRGQGIGSLMMQDAYELLQQIGCEAMTTYNPAVPAFYERHGLCLHDETVRLTLSTQRMQTPWHSRTASVTQVETTGEPSLKNKQIQSGRILSPVQLLQLLKDEEEPGFYALDFHLRPAEMSFRLSKGLTRAFCVLRDRTGDYENPLVHLWADDLSEDLVGAVINRAARMNIPQLTFLVKPEQVAYFAGFNVISQGPGTKVHYKEISID